MASVAVIRPSRSETADVLEGARLRDRLLELFDRVDRGPKKKEKKKPKKKGKTKEKSKQKQRDKSPDKFDVDQLSLELHGNPSSYLVFANVRDAVLEHQVKQMSHVYLRSMQRRSVDSDSDDDADDKTKDIVQKVPKIVTIGLCGVFELVKETQFSHPELCCRALKALLNVLQGQHPEALKNESPTVIESLYHLLLDLSTVPAHLSSKQLEVSLTSLACACLLSLVVARGDTSEILGAVAGLLMSPSSLATQMVEVPSVLTSLQKSVHAMLLGRSQLPEWLSEGIRENSKTATIRLDMPAPPCPTPDSREGHSAIASDGRFLYIHNVDGLHKVGSGYGGTVKGLIHLSNHNFPVKKPGWLAYAKDRLFFKAVSDNDGGLQVIDTDTLEPDNTYQLEGAGNRPNVLFSDGQNLGHIAASKDDSFVVRSFNPEKNPCPLVNELSLKLARKCVKAFGTLSYDQTTEIHSLNVSSDEDIVSISAGKEFAIVRTASGKVLYTGKSTALGIKQGGPTAGKWAELPITKSPKVVQVAVGHDGQHVLLVSEDGSVFFAGTPRRGEDADGSVAKGRRQPKSLKPKKMIQLEGRNIVACACNSGTSAVITREGEVFMYGKDTAHCDPASGQLSELRDVVVTSVALGKAHGALLTSHGHVYTFGINNKGQCGRDFVSGAAREMSVAVTMADEEEERDANFVCAPGTHVWKLDQCMVCTSCGECTGYGSNCVNAGRSDRNPGQPCSCGPGDSGCMECGICRACAGDAHENEKGPGPAVVDMANGGLFEVSARCRDIVPLDPLIERLGIRYHKMVGVRRVKVVPKNNQPKAPVEPQPGEAEQEHMRVNTRTPARVELGRHPAVQVTCGLHHTVVLLGNGDVYTFGGNMYGQLGHSDIGLSGKPGKVTVKSNIIQVAAGSNHTILLTASGQVYTFGSHLKGQLGRPAPEDDKQKGRKNPWFAVPGLVPGVGVKFGCRATWIGGSGDETFLRIDESLINAHTLASSKVIANHSCIGLLPTAGSAPSNIKCLMINKADGSCKCFSGAKYASLHDHSVCLDPFYDVLWSYSPVHQEICCYNVVNYEARHLCKKQPQLSCILGPDLAVPVHNGAKTTRSHAALHLLACLDTLTAAQRLGLTVSAMEKEKRPMNRVYTKEDYSVVNRFENHGGGWGYSGPSAEAIRFMTDTDILLGGFGLFGGRGEYFGKIKLYELGVDGGDNETDGELLAETEEVSYECGAREKYAVLFEEPVCLTANNWYIAWAKISGPSSDCGSSGQSVVTTDDQVVFKFKSSRKSNNGTDVNAGQLPQLLFRLPSHDTGVSSGKTDQGHPAYILTRQFSTTVSPESFDALLKLLSWSWNMFCEAVAEAQGLKGAIRAATMLDLGHLVYVSVACLRLIQTYVCEAYPSLGVSKRTPPETSRVAECVGNARNLLRKILSESGRRSAGSRTHDLAEGSEVRAGRDVFEKLADKILGECHRAFTMCFHAFYPSAHLKWLCLCELLNWIDPGQCNVEGCGRLLAAVMEALCHPTVKLTALMPINCEHSTELLLKRQYSSNDNTNSAAHSGDGSQFPLLVDHMIQRMETEGLGGSGHWTFREVLDKLLIIVVLPVRQILTHEKPIYPAHLVSNTCALIASIVSELGASATGVETDPRGSSQPLLTTPNRFTRTSQSAYWNTGNGSPDAVSFTVDQPGVVIAGVCIYGGSGQYIYEVELLDNQSGNPETNDQSRTERWNTLDVVKGTFGPDDCTQDLLEVKFERPLPIKEGVKYALRLRNHGPRTLNGDGGVSRVKCPDGLTFTFSACSLSINGTNHMRGQIPQILYYTAPQDGESHLQNNRAVAEYQARKNAINIASAIFRAATDLLRRAHGSPGDTVAEILSTASIFSTLLPLVAAHIGPVATVDPRGAVQVLGLVQEVLPPIADINSQLSHQGAPSTTTDSDENGQAGTDNGSTTMQHYAVVESDHPYKPATVSNFRVSFPAAVQWMVVDFDPLCATAQPEDNLGVYIPMRKRPSSPDGSTSKRRASEDDLPQDAVWTPVLKKFHGSNNWPSMAVILPGNKLCFSLETASDYVKNDKTSNYGFRCVVVGYEWNSPANEGLLHLEKEVSALGGMCAMSLMRKDIVLPPASVDEAEKDLEYIEETAQQVFVTHSQLLSKGFALLRSPTISQALDGNLPFSCCSNERSFLKDFVACTAGTSGGRLAAWLQPDSYVDPTQCDIVYNKEELRCGWPTVLSVRTKDQYGDLVNVPSIKVEARAMSMVESNGSNDHCHQWTEVIADTSKVFGGHPAPKLGVPYEVTVREKKDAYHSICMMKVAYENYSFEELRYAAPVIRRPSENMLVKAGNDGTYSATWTPGSTGLYNIRITLDGYDVGEDFKVEVRDAPHGMMPPHKTTPKRVEHQTNRMRKFVAPWSAGLRVRLNPSLQSEQTGIIKPNGVISFIDEIHNDDGVWLRLSGDSIRTWCPGRGKGLEEAWTLQYNQHLGRTLLIPTDEPKSILDKGVKEKKPRRSSQQAQAAARPYRGGPGVYIVVKCGSSGHNVRCHSSLKATPIGMLVLTNQITVMEDMVNSEGTWVKLDVDSVQSYCHEVDGEAWTLARGSEGIVYLQHEADARAVSGQEATSPFCVISSIKGDSTRGFDFTTSQMTPPSFSGFEPTQGAPLPPGFPVGEERMNTFVFGGQSGPASSVSCDERQSASPPPWPTFRQQEKSQFQTPKSSPQDGTTGIAFSPRTSSTHTAVTQEQKLFHAADIPEELRGVSVKDLVKALGKVGFGIAASHAVRVEGLGLAARRKQGSPNRAQGSPNRAKGSPNRAQGSPNRAKTYAHRQTELKDLSVRDVIRLLGESRVNGNGVTPPRTPPGTPKKTLSRSSSPKPMSGTPPKSSRPIAIPSAKKADLLRGSASPGHSPTHSMTPPHTPPSSRNESAGASFTTPPQTPPSIRRTLLAGRGSPSQSSSPQVTSLDSSPKVASRGSSPKVTSLSSSPKITSLGSSPQRDVIHPTLRATLSSPICTPCVSSSHGQPMRGHFSIGASPPREDIKLSPKPARKDRKTDRGRCIRTRRERTLSPVPQKTSDASAVPSQPHVLCKEAMSPSVAQCLRAVYAAFVWHEGIVHDAMACASFLKFHPDLPRTNRFPHKTATEKTTADPIPTRRYTTSEVTNLNMNEAVKVIESVRSKERHNSESKTLDKEPAVTGSSAAAAEAATSGGDADKESELPPTLRHLLHFWEELSMTTLKVIEQNLIQPNCMSNSRTRRNDKKDEEKGQEKKLNLQKGNLFGEAAGMAHGGGGDKEVICELCGMMSPHPVTYHMRATHPGCGKHAGGQGYNSAGNFCEGWAGNCGDGGIGGSTWYLMCSHCRDKYHREKRQKARDKTKKVRKKGTVLKPISPVMAPAVRSSDAHVIMMDNSMFLLGLASASGLNLPQHTKCATRRDVSLPSVSEDAFLEQYPFPQVMFRYLSQHGAAAADSAFADDVIFRENSMARGLSKSGNFEGLESQLAEIAKQLVEDQATASVAQGTLQTGSRSTEVSPGETNSLPQQSRHVLFQRSISEMPTSGALVQHCEDNNQSSHVTPVRRRNNSGSSTDGGLSLLKHPSAAMTRLLQSTTGGESGDQTLQRPVVSFVIKQHSLDGLQLAMKQALRKAACRVFALQAFNWLVRSVTQSTCLHDLMWYFVAALAPLPTDVDEETAVPEKKEKKDPDVDKGISVCHHPLSDVTVAGEAVHPLPQTFHTFLQTISDVMMFLPPGSALQQMAVRCWCLKFRSSDHMFLHKSHVFSNISKILSKSDEGWGVPLIDPSTKPAVFPRVESLKDLTGIDIKASSRQAMIASLTDGSTETFWESGDEDRNKTKTLTVTCNNRHMPSVLCLHIDNTRDLGNKVSSMVFYTGRNADDLKKLKQMDIESRHTGWIFAALPDPNTTVMKVEVKGPDHSLRLRQIKLLGNIEGASMLVGQQQSPLVMQQKNCESETLKVFRLLTSQVFGRLIMEEALDRVGSEGKEGAEKGDDVDLREHMVGILFSRSKLTHLQKQVCTHIVHAIRKETTQVKDEWLATVLTPRKETETKEKARSSDAYCFELLSMVLALSGSGVGRKYLAQQLSLLQDLLTLLHTASPRVQRQVTALLRRVLPDVSPQTLASVMDVPVLPPKDFSILANAEKNATDATFDPSRLGILDVFLACITKALIVQMKVKGHVGQKGMSTFRLSDSVPSDLGGRWWLQGRTSSQLADTCVSLLKDLASGALSEAWADVTKGAVAESILALTRLDGSLQSPSEFIKTPTMWLALASLCVLHPDHVERLSSGQWHSSGEHGPSRPTCENHDDGDTLAIILCDHCGNLCADCDRFLHLHRKTRSHQRQVFKEEEEAIRVDLHEGCGRTKLFWVMAVADAKTHKAMVEFREGAKGRVGGNPGGTGACRFCGAVTNAAVPSIGNICSDPECQMHAENACVCTLACGHLCRGVRNEEQCLPCLYGCRRTDGTDSQLKQDADDMCMVCFTEALAAAPCIQLQCGHVFHLHCCRRVLENRWNGPRITFGFSKCPICKADIDHPSLADLIEPIRALFDDVMRKALMRLEYEGLHKTEAITAVGNRFYNDPAGFAMERYSYYVCYKCQKAYYGGEARCEDQVAGSGEYDPSELVCGACSDVSQAQICPKHGLDFLEYKCHFCCSVAVFFCFGTIHFCNGCHDNFQRMTNIPKNELPHCPAGPRGIQLEGTECPLHIQHPPTGEEFALGCGICRNAHTF